MAQFQIGNKEAEKWEEEDVRLIIEQMRFNATNDSKILCLQDAIHSVNLYSSAMTYFMEKFPVFANIKKDIQDVIVSRVNAKALNNEFNPTASIWRMKQCGEKDESAVDHKNNGASFEPPVIRFKSSE